jgi:glycosyltransferase involved in cell wall biosynthesis
MNNFPFFSIIIPVYNRAHLIKKTIQTVLNQSFKEYEILVVDDGSTDDILEVIHSSTSDKIRYFKIPNSERGFARNFGAKHARGQWIYFLDSDDCVHDNHCLTAFQIITSNPDLTIFHLNYEILHKSTKQVIKINPDNIIYGNDFSCHGIFIKKSFFDKFKFIEDRTIAGLEDWELWLRISAHTKIKHFPVVTSAIIQHDERSVMQIDKDRWIKKVETFIQYVVNNPDIQKKYGSRMHLFYCGAYSYLALHLSFDSKNRKDALHYYFKSLKYYPGFFFSKRSLAIIKRVLFHV